MNATNLPFLDTGHWDGKLFLGGWNAAKTTLDIVEPGSGARLTRVGMASTQDVGEAAKRAKAAQAGWVALPFEERAGIFRKAAAIVLREAELISSWIVRETGGIPPKAGVELHMAQGILLEAAALLTQPK